MKKIGMLLSALLIVIFLAACGDDGADEDSLEDTAQDAIEDTLDNNEEDHNDDGEEQTDENEEGNTSEEASDQDDMKNMMDELNFDEIEIEISYGKDQEYEVEIERHSNGDIDAEIEDELNGEDINDDLEAFNKLYPKVKQLDIEQDTEKEEVIKQVLDIFELDDDYEEFEVEITFNDGTKLSYED